MENCLQRAPDINVVYTINEPAAAGAYRAIRAAGREKNILIVSVDGGCAGVRNVKAGVIGATSQQYPLKMASLGVEAAVEYAKTGKKVSRHDRYRRDAHHRQADEGRGQQGRRLRHECLLGK